MFDREHLLLAAGAVALAFGCNGSSGGSNTSSGRSTAPVTSKTVGTVTSGTKTGTGTVTSGTTVKTTTPTASNFLYVTNFASSTITTFDLDGKTGVPTLAATPDTSLPAGFGPIAIAVDPTGKIAWCTGDGTVNAMSNQVMPLDISGGKLTAGTATATTSPWPVAIAVNPKLTAIYTADENPAQSSGTVSMFVYTAGTGAIQAGGSANCGTLSGPVGVACDPTGSWLFVSDRNDQGVQSIPLTNGVLGTPGALVTNGSTNGGPYPIVVNPAGTFLWTGNTDGTISTYPLTNGNLGTATTTPATNSTTAAYPQSLALDPAGKTLVSANGGSALGGGSDDVAAFSIGASGTPTLLGSPVMISGACPAGVVFNQSGTVVYAANYGNNTISAFTVSATGLTAISGSPYAIPATDSGPIGVAVTR
ncbi:MAG TPA: beta-propeller fold lactonase family protein [Planctomycetota bacterium]|nr:beta-propeller fold lactonase family protein [Planctomycetota bacterium]